MATSLGCRLLDLLYPISDMECGCERMCEGFFDNFMLENRHLQPKTTQPISVILFQVLKP